MTTSDNAGRLPCVRVPVHAPECIVSVSNLTRFNDRRWIGCIAGIDKTIYLLGSKLSRDGGLTVQDHGNATIDQISMMYRPEGAYIAKPGFFLALDGYVQFDPATGYSVRTWRSDDDLNSVQVASAAVDIPLVGNTPVNGIFPFCFSRSVLELPDNSLLATAYGCFQEDRLVPEDRHSQIETPYKTRAFLVLSQDQGLSWHYYATIAQPIAGDPVVEGFNEPTMVRLDDGRLLCILRTGHYTPLYACWSSDDGQTWTDPLYTGLERGCWPCLRKLIDGRLALSYGQRFPAGWSRITPQGDWPRYEPIWPGTGLVRLAISADGTGETWDDAIVGSGMGSCYSTIYEVAPDQLFCQVDGWFWTMQLAPR